MKFILVMIGLINSLFTQYTNMENAKSIDLQIFNSYASIGYSNSFSSDHEYKIKGSWFKTNHDPYFSENASLSFSIDYKLFSLGPFYINPNIGVHGIFTQAYDILNNRIEEFAPAGSIGLDFNWYITSRFVPTAHVSQLFFYKSSFFDYTPIFGLGFKWVF